MIGLSEDNVRQYIRNHFSSSDAASAGRVASLLEAVNRSPELMDLAQIPFNTASLCLLWAEDSELPQLKTMSVSVLYYHLVVWLCRKHCGRHHLTDEERLSRGAGNAASSSLSSREVLARCAEEVRCLGETAFEAFRNNEIQSLGSALLRRVFPSRELLQSVVQSMGVLSAAQESERSEDYPVHYFVHPSYQEFFAALHMAQVAAMGEQADESRESWRRARLQEASRILMDPHPRNSFVRVLLAGLTTLDPSLAAGSAYFWDACIDLSHTNTLPLLGLHPHAAVLRQSQRVIREALLTHAAAATTTASTLPQRLRILERKFHLVAQWTGVCHMKALAIQFDYFSFSQATLNARDLFVRRLQQLEHDRNTFGLPVVPPVPAASLLLAVPSWEAALAATKERAAHANEDIRALAAEALGYAGCHDTDCMRLLYGLLADKYWDVRKAAAEALGRIGFNDASTLAALRGALQDIYAVRIAAAEALGHIGSGDQESLTALRSALSDGDWFVRSAAANALGRIGASDEMTLSLLRYLLRDGSEYVIRAGIRALEQMRCRDSSTVAALRNAQRNSNKRVRVDAAKALFRLGKSDSSSLSILKKDDSDLVHSIGRISAKDIKSYASLINAALKDSDRDLRIASMEALARISNGDPATASSLRTELRTKDAHVRAAAAEAIARVGCGDEASLAALRHAVSDRSWEVALAAAQALKHMGKSLDVSSVVWLVNNVSSVGAFEQKALEISYELHLALLRVPPVTYAAVFALQPGMMTSVIAQRAFVCSVWVHSSSVIMEPERESMAIDGQSVSLTGSTDELRSFVAALQEAEMDILLMIGDNTSDELREVVMSLRQPVETPRNTAKYLSMGRFIS